MSSIIYKHANNFSNIVFDLMNVEKMLRISGQTPCGTTQYLLVFISISVTEQWYHSFHFFIL